MKKNNPDKQENNRDTLGRFIKGFSGNPEGRPKGKTLKEWAKEKMMEMTDKERNEFLKGLPKEIIWRMAEGNPAQDVTSGGKEIQIPIYGGQSIQSIQGHDSDKKDIQADQTNKGS